VCTVHGVPSHFRNRSCLADNVPEALSCRTKAPRMGAGRRGRRRARMSPNESEREENE
jgi:hypothetical protein